MDNIKISVVTISFNQAIFLRKCIDSVLAQNFKDIEYIVVDPGSSDGSREIIESYGNKIIKIFKSDIGPADGLNNGFAVATGDIYCFINADDYFLPGAFMHAYSILNDSKFDVLLGSGVMVNEAGVVQRPFYPSYVSKRLYVNGAVTFFQQGMFFKSSIYKNINGFNVYNKSSWDGELLFSFILNGARFKRSMTKLAAFRIYSTSITGSQRLLEIYKGDQRRLYQSVYGGQKNITLFSRVFYRIVKLLFDPKYTFYRFFKRS